MLLSPVTRNTPPQQRNFRWVARRPAGPPAARRRATGPGQTPRYSEIPRWGLADQTARATAGKDALVDFGKRAPRLLVVTAVFFGLSAIAECLRYGVLLYNRTWLVPPLVLALSDAFVLLVAIVALLAALAAAIACSGWLISVRARIFAAQGHRDPRRRRTVVLGCVVPVLNLVAPGIFLNEIAATATVRQRRLIRWWWLAWVFNAALVVAALSWRSVDSLQAKANGVLFTAFTDIVAAGVAVLTLLLIKDFEGENLLGHKRMPKRWVIATGPVTPVIEPIRPAKQETGVAAVEAPRDGAESAQQDPQQEVMAR
ncbi:DUF4328 domain-containing protein [Skermania sp. ID1734]|nr:DUF4328 domain-containing protein [Skermania sp. ID1734]